MWTWKQLKNTCLLGMGGLFLSLSTCANSQSNSSENFSPRATKNLDKGDVEIVYAFPQDEVFQKIYEVLQETQEFETIADRLNSSYALPKNLTVKFKKCDEANAFYVNSKIEVFYELIQQYVEIFGDNIQSDQDFADEVIYSGLFTFFHELGHAFIDLYQLPITGLEENVADEFAAMMLLAMKDKDAVLAGMEQFDADAEEEEQLKVLPFWDAHGLGAQRYFNIECIIYGSDTEAFANLIRNELPEERAQLCPEDYQRRLRSWKFLLSPYRKKTSTLDI